MYLINRNCGEPEAIFFEKCFRFSTIPVDQHIFYPPDIFLTTYNGLFELYFDSFTGQISTRSVIIQGYTSIGWSTATFSPCTIGELFSINAPCLSLYSVGSLNAASYVGATQTYQISQSVVSYYGYNAATGTGVSHIPNGVDSAFAVTIALDNSSIHNTSSPGS